MKKMLIVGAGGIGGKHIRAALATGRAQVSICEPDARKRESACNTFKIDRVFSDLKAVPLAEFDAAIICAPAHVHVPLAMACTASGLPFLLEKPVSVSLDRVDDMIGQVNMKQLVCRVGYTRRCFPGIRRLKEEIDRGRVGQVLMIQVNVGQDYRKYRPDYQAIYFARESMGGGALLDFGSHAVDLLLWLFGSVREVVAMYDRLAFNNVECEDSVLLNLRFKDSPGMAHVAINLFQKPYESRIEVIGSAGNLIWNDFKGTLQFADNDSGVWETEDVFKGKTLLELGPEIYRTQIAEYLDMLEGKPGILCTLEEARDNLRVILAAKESYRSRTIISL